MVGTQASNRTQCRCHTGLIAAVHALGEDGRGQARPWLIETVKTYDPQYEDVTGEAWRRVLGPGIDYMKSRHATRSA